MRKWCIAAVVVSSLGLASVAEAGTVQSDRFTGSDGERNDVEVTFDGPSFSIIDRANPIVAGPGCAPIDGGAVRCSPPPRPCGPGADCFNQIRIDLGDLDDKVIVKGSTASGPNRITTVTVNGQAGADLLDLRLPVSADGGDGNDTLLGSPQNDLVLVGGNGADLVDGRAGIDSVSYAGRTKPVSVSLDGKPNDGAAGENDDIRVEEVTGGYAADRLVGSDRNDVLAGGGGADTIDGRSGNDTITVGGRTFDGAPIIHTGANVTCGAGDDVAHLAIADSAAYDCEVAGFDGAPATLDSTFEVQKAVRFDALKLRASRTGTVALTLRRVPLKEFDSQADPYVGRVSLQASDRKARTTAASFSLAPNAASRLTVRLDSRTRRRLGRSRAGISLLGVREVSVPTAANGTKYTSKLRLIGSVRVLPPRRAKR